MKVVPVSIEQEGPGIDLTNQPEGVSIDMSDPVRDLEYARNAVTMVFDLSEVEHVRLKFEAMEYGDEPHAPPAGPFGSDVNFDGVAVSADGANWYEVQGLRELRSDKFTAFDVDVDAAVAAAGISYGSSFKIRFCQYDDNPAPMDGISLRKIEVTADLRAVMLHLAMDDNAASATVVDSAAGHHDQAFVDPGGNPNTSAHTAAGAVGTALAFDGVDDRIVLTGESYRSALATGHNFTVAMWWKTNNPAAGVSLHFLSNYVDAEPSISWSTRDGNVTVSARFLVPSERWVSKTFTGGADNAWHHYAMVRQGTVITIYRDGVAEYTNDGAGNTGALAPASAELTIGCRPGAMQFGPGYADDLRVFDRALSAEEVAALVAGV